MNRISALLLGLLCVLLQITLVRIISIHSVRPDLIVVFVVWQALISGPTLGVVWGFGLGLLLDAVSGGVAGLGSLVYAVAGFVGGQFKAGKIPTRPRFLISLPLATSAEFALLFYFCEPWKEIGYLQPLLLHSLPGVLYTCCLGFIWTLIPWARFSSGKS